MFGLITGVVASTLTAIEAATTVTAVATAVTATTIAARAVKGIDE